MRKGIWQPIETAPTDEIVDLYSLHKAWVHIRHCNARRYFGKWYAQGSSGWEEVPSPTHWMPLPDPPKTETKKEEP